MDALSLENHLIQQTLKTAVMLQRGAPAGTVDAEDIVACVEDNDDYVVVVVVVVAGAVVVAADTADAQFAQAEAVGALGDKRRDHFDQPTIVAVDLPDRARE